MAKWSIQIPYRDRSDSLSAVGELANTLESDEDCAAARQLVIHGVMAGLPTAGDLLDRLSGSTPPTAAYSSTPPRARRPRVDRHG